MNQYFHQTMSAISVFFSTEAVLRDLVISACLLLGILFVRFLVIRSLRASQSIPTSDRRQWIVTIKTLFLFLFVFGLTVVWAEELETFAVSLVAVAAAIVIAFKEVIMNISGYFSRISAKPFSIGDRIEINGIRGDVIDQNLFFTKLLEIGPYQATHQYTGRSINLPNSLFLSHNIINESFTSEYSLHVFHVPLLIDQNLSEHSNQLLASARRICEREVANAQKVFDAFGRRQSIDPPNVAPRVHFRYYDKDTVELIVRIPVRPDNKGRVEQEIILDFNKYYLDARRAEATTSLEK